MREFILLALSLFLIRSAPAQENNNTPSWLSAQDAGLTLSLNGTTFLFDKTSDDWQPSSSAGPRRVFEKASSFTELDQKNHLLASPDGTIDACSGDYISQCRPPESIYTLGYCAYRTWLGWPAGGGWFLAQISPAGVMFFPPETSKIPARASVRDFACDGEQPMFAVFGAGVMTKNEQGWSVEYSAANGLMDNNVSSIYFTDGARWFVSDNGVQRRASGWTYWKIASIKTAVLRAAPDASGWTLERYSKQANATVAGIGGGYYCVKTGHKHRGWVKESAVFKNKGAFSVKDVQAKPSDTAGHAGTLTGVDCPHWELLRDVRSADGEWIAAETDSALAAVSESVPVLSKQH